MNTWTKGIPDQSLMTPQEEEIPDQRLIISKGKISAGSNSCLIFRTGMRTDCTRDLWVIHVQVPTGCEDLWMPLETCCTEHLAVKIPVYAWIQINGETDESSRYLLQQARC